MAKVTRPTPYIHSTYLAEALDPGMRTKILRQCLNLLRPVRKLFDTVVFRGYSGALIAPEIASRMKKHLLFVRKEGDDSHTSLTLEGHYTTERFLIVDDIVATGHTVNTILDTIARKQRECFNHPSCPTGRGVREPGVCFAILLYNRRHSDYDNRWLRDKFSPRVERIFLAKPDSL